jgi:hypothetical protein
LLAELGAGREASILEKPRYVTKQAQQIMAQEGKLDLLLKTLRGDEQICWS